MPSLANHEREVLPGPRAGAATRSILVIYSFPRLWSMGPGSGSPDFTHSLMALTRVGSVTVVYPRADRERSSPTLLDEAPPGLRGIEFRDRRVPLMDASRGPRGLRVAMVALNLPLRVLNYLLFNLAAYGPAARAAAERRPDLVTAHGTMGVWTASRIAGRTQAPLLVRLFGVSLGMWGFHPFLLFLGFEEVLALKAPAAHWVIADDGSGGGAVARRMGVAPEKITMLRPAAHRGTPGATVDRARYRERLGLAPDTLLVVRVCRLWRQQRIGRLIEALPRTTKAGAPVAAVIIGDGPERENLQRLAARLEKRVVFTGPVANDLLPEHYLAADLYAATGDRTNLGQSVLEAMGHGLAVVAIDCGETRALIRDGVNGRLVGSDPAALERALADVLDDAEARARYGREALRIAEREIADPNGRVEAEAGVLARLLDGRGRVAR